MKMVIRSALGVIVASSISACASQEYMQTQAQSERHRTCMVDVQVYNPGTESWWQAVKCAGETATNKPEFMETMMQVDLYCGPQWKKADDAICNELDTQRLLVQYRNTQFRDNLEAAAASQYAQAEADKEAQSAVIADGVYQGLVQYHNGYQNR